VATATSTGLNIILLLAFSVSSDSASDASELFTLLQAAQQTSLSGIVALICHALQVSSYDMINPGGYYSARVWVLGSQAIANMPTSVVALSRHCSAGVII
jgi:hypothetical protein